jgi:cytochrome bd-type quinol oxidase subunit 2
MAKKPDDVPVVITGNEARGGVHDHRLHYVLVFGLAGGVIAFVGIGLYFGYNMLTQTLSQTSLTSNPTTLVSYALLIALAAIGTVLLLGLWNLILGSSQNISQRVMRWRVVLQFIALCVVMAALYLSGKY